MSGTPSTRPQQAPPKELPKGQQKITKETRRRRSGFCPNDSDWCPPNTRAAVPRGELQGAHLSQSRREGTEVQAPSRWKRTKVRAFHWLLKGMLIVTPPGDRETIPGFSGAGQWVLEMTETRHDVRVKALYVIIKYVIIYTYMCTLY